MGLPLEHRARLLALTEQCNLQVAQVLSEVSDPTAYIYFPLDAILSVVAVTGESDSIGLALIGREGMLGAEVALGVFDRPIRVVVQGSGTALRIGIDAFKQELELNVALRRAMRRYVDVLMRQLSRSAACSHFHEIGPRLARWLLMSQDRSRSDSFHITHDFLSQMLGVRRVGVTAAAFEFQREGMIQYHRGNLVILDRPALKFSACSCYAVDLRAWSKKAPIDTTLGPLH